MNFKRSNQIIKCQQLNQLKPHLDSQNSIVLYDRKLKFFSSFKNWISLYPNSISLSAGENLKSISEFSKILQLVHHIAKKKSLGKDFIFVGIGGGSITDFVGFLASVYQRGHPVAFVPSTWLCAVDSAFGGKNGLNLAEDKNQVGTIYQPSKVLLVKNLLMSQPDERTIDGYSETIKMAIIRDPKLFKSIEMKKDSIYKNLEKAIHGKMKIVKNDPLETKGIRYVLNFGHTFGHVFETSLGISHGVAVLLGQIVAVKISEDLGYCKKMDAELVLKKLIVAEQNSNLKKALNISRLQLMKKLSRDKKFKSGKMNFVFFEKIGRCKVDRVDINTLMFSFSKISKVIRQST